MISGDNRGHVEAEQVVLDRETWSSLNLLLSLLGLYWVQVEMGDFTEDGEYSHLKRHAFRTINQTRYLLALLFCVFSFLLYLRLLRALATNLEGHRLSIVR